MSLVPLPFGFINIGCRFLKLDATNVEKISKEISEFIEAYGIFANNYILNCILRATHRDQKEGGNRSPSLALLTQQAVLLIEHPSRITPIYEAIQKILKSDSSKSFSDHLRIFNLTAAYELALCLRILEAALGPDDFVKSVRTHARKKFTEVIQSYLNTDLNSSTTDGGLQETTSEVLQVVLAALHRENFNIVNITQSLFLEKLRKDFQRDQVPIILSPFLYPDHTDSPLDEMATNEELPLSVLETSPVHLIKDIGYSFTASLEKCQEDLANIFEMGLTPPMVAKIIAMMIVQHSNLESAHFDKPSSIWAVSMSETNFQSEPKTWQPEVFVQALSAFIPNLNWREVFNNLDHPGFIVKDKPGLKLLFTILKCGLQNNGISMSNFPLDLLFTPWDNKDGQLSLITMMIRHTEVFNLIEHPFNPVAISCLNNPPDRKDSVWWTSQNLIQLLVDFTECGYKVAFELLKIPFQACPDVLVVAMLHLNNPSCAVSVEIITKVIPVFLDNHPNSTIIIHMLWREPFLEIVLNEMVKWYREGNCDFVRLKKILDIAQGQNDIMSVLNVKTDFQFIIDMACLASRRNYIQISIFISTKSKEFGDAFNDILIRYLQYHLQLISQDREHSVSHLPMVIVNEILGHLNYYKNVVNKNISQRVDLLNARVNLINQNQRQLELAYKPMQNLNPVHNLTPQFAAMSASGQSLQALKSHSALTKPYGPTFTLSTDPSMQKNPPTHDSQVLECSKKDLRTYMPYLSSDISKTAEVESNEVFQRYFSDNSAEALDRIVKILNKLRISKDVHDLQVFSSLILNLLDEYKHVHEYPDKARKQSAQLLGAVIQYNIVLECGIALALRLVLHALHNSPESKYFQYGVEAANVFRTRFKEFTKFCIQVKQIPHYRQLPAQLSEWIEAGVSGQDLTQALLPTPSISRASRTPLPSTSTDHGEYLRIPLPNENLTSLASATNINTLLSAIDTEDFSPPPEQVECKTVFIFNNLTQSNIATKCNELKNILLKEFRPWLSRFIVMQRISMDDKFHKLYMSFIDELQWPDFIRLVRSETYRNIKILLKADKCIANFSDRMLLKNFGHWLGMLTLARNIPVLQTDIDIKALLLEAHQCREQELLYVIPFIAKILVSCEDSKAFKPPCPWTMGIINVLAEYHREPNTKLNLKFEIEVLCKTLSVDLNEIKPGEFLKNKKDYLKYSYPQLGDLNEEKKISEPVPSTWKKTEDSSLPSLQLKEDLNKTEHKPEVAIIKEPMYNYPEVELELLSFYIYNETTIDMFKKYPYMKEFIVPNIQKAIVDNLPKIVESMSPYRTSAEMIIRLDFQNDIHANYMHLAAHNLVRFIICNAVTVVDDGKHIDSVMASVKENLLSAFKNASESFPNTEKMLEEAVSLTAKNNWNVIAAVTRKLVAERCIQLVDQNLLPDYMERTRAAFFESKSCSNNDISYSLPPQLRLSIFPRKPDQLAVYEALSTNISCFKQLDLVLPLCCEAQKTIDEMTKSILANPTNQLSELYHILSEAQRFICMYATGQPALSTLVRHVGLAYEEVTRLLNTRGAKCDNLVQKVVTWFMEGYALAPEYRPIISTYRNILINMIVQIEISYKMGRQWLIKEVTVGCVAAAVPFRYNLDAVTFLIRNHLISLPEYDGILVGLLKKPQNDDSLISFIKQLVCVAPETVSNIIMEYELPNTLALLNQILSFQFKALRRQAMQPNYLLYDSYQGEMATQRQPQAMELLHRSIPNLNQNPPIVEQETFLQIPNIGNFLEDNVNYSESFSNGIKSLKVDNLTQELIIEIESLLDMWVQLYFHSRQDFSHREAFNNYRLHFLNRMKTADIFANFLRIGVQKCTRRNYQLLTDEKDDMNNGSVLEKYYAYPDSLAKVFVMIMKDLTVKITRLNCINNFFGLVGGLLMKDHDDNNTTFSPRPYQRILLNVLLELLLNDDFKDISYEIISAFCNLFHMIRPMECPGFFYYWFDLIAHRNFIAQVLSLQDIQCRYKTWGLYYNLIVDLFQAVHPLLSSRKLSMSQNLIRKGVLRFLIVLKHDFPNFLTFYRNGLLDEIPIDCYNIRNIIMDAKYAAVQLPNPTSVDLSPENNRDLSGDPNLLISPAIMIQPAAFKLDLDSYLANGKPSKFLTNLPHFLEVTEKTGIAYNMKRINALVLYICGHALNTLKYRNLAPSMTTIVHTPHMEIFFNLSNGLPIDGRYMFTTSMISNLTYPNSHTYYFRCVLVHLFAESLLQTREIIVRCFVERLLYKSLVPWGVSYAFNAIVANPSYNFWEYEFVSESEISNLIKEHFKRVAACFPN